MTTNGKDPMPMESGKRIPLEFQFPEDERGTFANFAAVQGEAHEVYLSFFEIRPPLILGTEEQKREQIEKTETVPAKCVARIVMSRGRIPGLINALQTQLKSSDMSEDDGPQSQEDIHE